MPSTVYHTDYEALADYVDSWYVPLGDALFRRDTREALDQAAQLYTLAAKMLGPRPQSITPRLQPPALLTRLHVPAYD